MTTQNYLVVESDVVTNCVVWDGNTQDWQPPSDATMLVQATTPAMVWVGTTTENLPATVPPTYTTTYNLEQVIGAGNIGFTWNGTVLTTNQPQPASIIQPRTTGTLTA
jgi:hypothetical protein